MRLCCQLLALVLVLVPHVLCKVFERCELVRELSRKRHRIPAQEVATWVCIARHESQYNTSAVGHLNADLSGDHGLFQISDQYWCSPPGVGQACGLACDQLEDDDIADDVVCARRIHRAHKRRTGDGFTAWAVYGPHCRGDNSAFTRGCQDWQPTTTTTTTTTTTPAPTTTDEPSTEDELAASSTTDAALDQDDASVLHRDVTSSGTDLSSAEPVAGSRARQFLPVSSGTSSPWSRDPNAAWLAVHYDPRFLDRN